MTERVIRQSTVLESEIEPSCELIHVLLKISSGNTLTGADDVVLEVVDDRV